MSSGGVWLGPVRPPGLLSAPVSPLLLLLQLGQTTPQAAPGPGFPPQAVRAGAGRLPQLCAGPGVRLEDVGLG